MGHIFAGLVRNKRKADKFLGLKFYEYFMENLNLIKINVGNTKQNKYFQIFVR